MHNSMAFLFPLAQYIMKIEMYERINWLFDRDRYKGNIPGWQKILYQEYGEYWERNGY